MHSWLKSISIFSDLRAVFPVDLSREKYRGCREYEAVEREAQTENEIGRETSPFVGPKPPRYVDPELFASAERIRNRARNLAETIRQSGDITTVPADLLPIDEEIDALSRRSRAPRLVLTPAMKGNDPATASVYLCAYFHVEGAFTDAALIVGRNQAGQIEALKGLKSRLQRALQAIDSLAPEKLPQHLNMLFRDNPLPNRRRERALPARALAASLADTQSKLKPMLDVVDEDLQALCQLGSGRPPDIQKEAFAREIGRLWQRLTGRPASYKPGSPFAHFLAAAWNSGVTNTRRDESFDRVMRRIAKR